ncbi:MAG: radical SAM protein [Clostridiales bacterium]|uniref:radical SAM protein n=1 Tax=Evtepia sp. TaxID=2773933 RepID=UPI0029877658|nr:radical SAM protein [Evtepia sp.]MDD7290184.1 radical SAM protein [Clostridiales bacterium]MDY3992738.1 radical SAM protein [Evtepia sp.]MDY4431287.1 radical SAM protein [Evtepia sp.]
MRYEGQIYRPPGEWRSYLLQCTVGCTHNKCTFCGMYKPKKFHIRPMKEIIEDIAMARAYYGAENVDKVFLCDGDAIVMRQEQLLQILEALYAAFPNLRQVTTYAGTRSTMTKSPEQLKELRQAGLTRAYLGVETGWDELLEKVHKGVTSAQMIEATDRIKEAGIDLWLTVILGLAGPGEPAKKHIEETIKVLNRMQANHVSCLSYMPEPNSPMYQDVREGRFQLITPRQALEETRALVEGLNYGPFHFTSNHASNYLPLKGTLPDDREKFLAMIDSALGGKSRIRSEHSRAL